MKMTCSRGHKFDKDKGHPVCPKCWPGFYKKNRDEVKHKDGSLWAHGEMVDDKPNGYWEWFRKDGSKMRTGFFDKGKQVGEWTTYDKDERVVKITNKDKK